MSFICSPTLYTPLLKIPLVLSGLTATIYGITPPNPPAKDEEQHKYGDKKSNGVSVLRVLAKIVGTTLHGIALSEVAVILARQFPSSLSSDLLSVLTSSPEHAGGVRITHAFVAGWAMTITGGLIRVWCHRTLGKFFKWELSVQDDHQLLTSGPYAIVRHPSYLGMLLLAVGNILTNHAGGSWLAESGVLDGQLHRVLRVAFTAYWSMIVIMLWRRMDGEDAILKQQFGEQWRAWARRTPYKIIPFVY